MMRKRGGLTDSTAPTRPVAVPFGAATIFVLIALFVSVLALAGPLSDDQTRSLYSDIGLIPAAGMMLISCGYAARRAAGRIRTAWTCMAVAGALWMCGELSWFIEQRLFDVEPWAVSISDVFSMAAIIPVAAALLLLPPPARSGRDGMINLLGCGVVAFSVLFITRTIAIALHMPELAEATIAGFVYVIYPISDVVLLILAFAALIKTAELARASLIVLVVGIVGYAGADAYYGVTAPLGRYDSGSITDLGWFAGYLLMALAATAPGATDPHHPPQHQRGTAIWYSLLVYVPLLVSAAVAATLPAKRLDLVLVVSGCGVLVTFAVRQVLLSIEHAALNRAKDDQVVALRDAGERLRRQVAENRRITQSVADGVLVLDPTLRVIMANAAVARILQTDVDELRGRPLDDLLDGTDHDDRVVHAVSAGETMTSVDAHFRRGGQAVPIEVTVGPIMEGEVALGTVLTIRDITARRAIEQMKNEFISVISHELRTPLTSIRGSLALLDNGMGGPLQPTGARMVTLALESSERLTRLIDDLLDVERLESGRLTMTYEDCDASQLVEHALREMRGLAQQSDVVLVQHEAAGRVWADPDRIVQTLTNLISNAVKFSDPGASVTLTAMPVEQDGTRFVEFSVADEGRGIPPEKQETIFGRFEQVDSSDSRQRGGSGLGLAISRSIVELHGGRIWVISEVGRGSDFRFLLPVARPAREEAVEAVRPPESAEPTPTEGDQLATTVTP